VALPMDEQRILEEMERMLAADDPRLAARLAAFGQPGIGQVLRTRRARATLSLMVLVLVAAIAAVIYMMTVFRPGGASQGSHPRQHSSQPAGPRSGREGARLIQTTARCAPSLAPSCAEWRFFSPFPGQPPVVPAR